MADSEPKRKAEGRDVKPPRVGGPGCLQPCGGFVTTAAELMDGPTFTPWRMWRENGRIVLKPERFREKEEE